MEQQASAGGIFQKEKVKKETFCGCLGTSPAAATLVSVPLTLPSHVGPATAQLIMHVCSPRDGAHLNLPDRQMLVLAHLQVQDKACLTLLPRGTKHPTPAPPGKQQRKHTPASAAAATAAPLPCRADWLSMRKAETPPQRRTAGLRESAISRKT